MKFKYLLIAVIVLASPFLFFLFFQYVSRAAAIKANLLVDVKNTRGPFPDRWKALAQGGEEQGVRMLENVVPQVAQLYPRYIRLDHIYDYYDVIKRDSGGKIIVDFNQLDETVCDIYHTGAKPFFSLSYMPEVMSGDTTLVSEPKSWDEWTYVVQKTIEHYSGKSVRLCGQITGFWKTDIHYEVWNEPDLFGKWSIYGGKDYKTLYYYSARGASSATDVYPFLLGGPVTTALYKNWITTFLDYVDKKSLRLDFLSWHHYSKNTDDYVTDVKNLTGWLSDVKYAKFQLLPKVISEWGFDSDPNPLADTATGAAHTVAAIRNFINTNIESAFLFEIKDGATPRWGILSREGEKNLRYNALELLNRLQGDQLDIQGEGSFVHALGSMTPEKIVLVLVNYDLTNNNTENVPISFVNLADGAYTYHTAYLGETTAQTPRAITVTGQSFKESIIMPPNSVVLLELTKI